MSQSNQLYNSYLSQHFQHIADPAHYRKSRLAYIACNYAKFLPIDHAAYILDIGPGFGELIEWLTKEQQYVNVQAIDISPEVIDYCNSVVPNSATRVEDTRKFLQAHPASFDCIFLLHVLEHIPKQETIPLLEALYQALRPNGKLIIEVPNMANPFTGLHTRYGDFTHETGYTNLSLEYVLHHAGFQQTELFGLRLPNERFSRFLQRCVQLPVMGLLALMYRAYGVTRIPVLAASLCAVSVKVE